MTDDWISDDDIIEPLRTIIHRCTDRQLVMILMAVSQLVHVRQRDGALARGRKVSESRRHARHAAVPAEEQQHG